MRPGNTRRGLTCLLFSAALLAGAVAILSRASSADDTTPSFGGTFSTLLPEQQTLIRAWYEQYGKITSNQIDPETGYDALKPSVRTTFEAVTHALYKTTLTGENGQPMGRALDLVKQVEAVRGQTPHTRGDEQFRMYVLLQDDAVEKLYHVREFKRTGDNTVFHIGYPVNFRQQGGAPSIQFSVTRTGYRADIDVDYRSSHGPQALINGHLTAANSDVRAGGNYEKHTRRWSAFGDWWRQLFGSPNPIPKSDLVAVSSRDAEPPVKAEQGVEEAVADYYKSWLVDGKPENALAYMSVKANACISQYTGEDPRNSLLRLRLYQHMKQIGQDLGKADQLSDVMHGIVITGADAKPEDQKYGNLFSITMLSDATARALDCRKTMDVNLVEDLPEATNQFGNFYGASTLLRAKDGRGPTQLRYQIWTRERNSWKLVAWYLSNPFKPGFASDLAPPTAPKEQNVRKEIKNEDLARAGEKFLQALLIEHDTPLVNSFLAEETQTCGKLKLGLSKSTFLLPAKDVVQEWLKEVSKQVPGKGLLTQTIQGVEVDESSSQVVAHAHPEEYTLVRISDQLLEQTSCAFRASGKAITRTEAAEPAFAQNAYQLMFAPRHNTDDRGVVVFTWEQRNGKWLVTSFDIHTH